MWLYAGPRLPTACLASVCFFSLSSFILSSSSAEDNHEDSHSWQGCETILAPSTMGWGVYAAKPFQEGDIVDLAPLFVMMKAPKNEIHNSALNDYNYGHFRNSDYYHAVLFGNEMFYNHHPEPNVLYTYIRGVGGDTQAAGFVSFVARRDIVAGEQLFSTYGDDDEGRQWFAERGMEMQAPADKDSKIVLEDLELFQAEFCSKIYAGLGLPSWKQLGLSDDPARSDALMDVARLAPFDAGFGNAKAKVAIASGKRIEISTGLLLSRKLVKGSILGGLILSWEDDLKEEHKQSLRILRHSGQVIVQYQGHDTSWRRIDRFDSFEDLAILPAAGNIALVRRVGDSEASNCRLVLHWQGAQHGSVGVTLELVATADIAVGEVLKLNLPQGGSAAELALLKDELELTGQPCHSDLFLVKSDDEL
jgi:hypothetical protein